MKFTIKCTVCEEEISGYGDTPSEAKEVAERMMAEHCCGKKPSEHPLGEVQDECVWT